MRNTLHFVSVETYFTIFLITGLHGVMSLLIREHFYVTTPMTWDGAQEYCRERYSDLSSVLSKDDVDWVLAAAGNQSMGKAWIGLHRDPQDSWWNWKWSDGGMIDFKNWKSDQPDNYKGDQYCVLAENGLWVDNSCSSNLTFFCFSNKIMTLVQEKRTWEGALDYCRNTFTDLVSLASESTDKQVLNYIERAQTEFVWMGLRFLAGEWLWVNRDQLEYKGWSNTDNNQCPALPLHCGALSKHESVWEAKRCGEMFNFICYKEVPRALDEGAPGSQP